MYSIDWTALGTWVGAIATIAAAFAAWVALTAWQDQMHGRAKFDIAKRLLMAANDLGDRFNGARNQFVTTAEYPPEYSSWLPDYRQTLEAQRKIYVSVFSGRWKYIEPARAHLLSLLPEARVFLPPEVEVRAEAIIQCAHRLNIHMTDYIELVSQEAPGRVGSPASQAYEAQFKRARRGVYSGSISGADGTPIDQLQVDILEAQSRLTMALKPFIDPPRRRPFFLGVATSNKAGNATGRNAIEPVQSGRSSGHGATRGFLACARRYLGAIGLTLGIAGVIMIWVWAPPQPSFQRGMSIVPDAKTPLPNGMTEEQYERSQADVESHYWHLSEIGLLLILVGFGLQLTKELLPPDLPDAARTIPS
jgi:hypothetical protein